MDEKERLSVYTTIAAVLHLGNVEFEDDPDDNRGGSRIKESTEKYLAFTAKLMGSDPGIMFNVDNFFQIHQTSGSPTTDCSGDQILVKRSTDSKFEAEANLKA